jgi:UDP-N-acetyl-2-amino-2-deoxyglucuronate dehydrogenase
MAYNFALIGTAGYIAPRHLKAIKDTGNILRAALDPHDSVGILDQYFPETEFFTEFERFDRFIDKIRRQDPERKIQYVSICSPNYLHDAHIRFALRAGANVICEKPIVLNPWNIDSLQELEKEYGARVFNVLQLRIHPAILKLRDEVKKQIKQEKTFDVTLTYITMRGNWYLHAWKGDISKSGGLATNIGVHFFDLLIWLFGNVQSTEVHLSTPRQISGFIKLEHARVRWFLSIDPKDLPNSDLHSTYRKIEVDDKEIEFSEGFADLHTEVYREIFKGNGYGLGDAKPAIELVHNIREAKISEHIKEKHPLAKRYLI